MCGITGILNFDGRPIDLLHLQGFTDSLSHRGPDAAGYWISPTKRNAGLGHRRLSILDLSDSGAQPMHSKDYRHHICFNGEIFNFIEIREALKKKGHSFLSDSDTEVILASYREWGPAMTDRFNGMWAFAIYDSVEENLFLSRDRFGIKPLFYVNSPNSFYFASETKAFRKCRSLALSIDSDTFTQAIINPFSIEGTERTLLNGVKRLPAGHNLLVSKHETRLWRWWNTSEHLVDTTTLSDEEQILHFKELFFDAVKLRMRSDVPIGTCLSGGFDSSAILCTVAEVAREHNSRSQENWHNAYIASFPGAANDETQDAMRVVHHTSAKPHLVPITEADAVTEIDKVLHDFEEIYISLPTAIWRTYRTLRTSGTVVSLDGHGADELMGGYKTEERCLLESAPSLLRAPLSNASLFMSLTHKIGLHSAAKEFWRNHSSLQTVRSNTNRLAHKLQRFGINLHNEDPYSDLFSFRQPNNDFPLPFASCDTLPEHWSQANINYYKMFHADTLPTILRNFDRLSMAHGVESRMPFLDWRLVCFVMSLSSDVKFRDGYTKWIARQATKNVVPDTIRLNRNKVGFNSPMPEWLSGPLRPWLLEQISKKSDYIDVDSKKLQKILSRKTSTPVEAWTVVCRTWPILHGLWYEHNFLKG